MLKRKDLVTKLFIYLYLVNIQDYYIYIYICVCVCFLYLMNMNVHGCIDVFSCYAYNLGLTRNASFCLSTIIRFNQTCWIYL